jgi:hypothetical protein
MGVKQRPLSMDVSSNRPLAVYYEAANVCTNDDPPESFSWVKRIPVGKPIPGRIIFQLKFPNERPMLAEPRVYRLDGFSNVESTCTDFGLEKADGWQRLSDPSNE